MNDALGPKHPLTLLFALNAALALEDLGRHNEALTVVLSAEPVLRESFGTDAPMFIRVQQLKSRLQSPMIARRIAPQGAPTGHRNPVDFFS